MATRQFNRFADPRSSDGVSYGAAESVFQGRLVDWSINELRVIRESGRTAEVNGDILLIPSAGYSFFADSTSTINLNGNDTGNLVVADTVYHAYLSNSLADFAPLSLRLSTRAPARTTDTGDLYLGNTGNARNWRYVGTVWTSTGTPQFRNSVAERKVASYFNRYSLPLFFCPNYSDNAADTSYNFAPAAAWSPLAASASVQFVSLGEDSVLLGVELTGAALAAQAGVGIDLDGEVLSAARTPAYAAGERLTASRAVQLARGGYTATAVGLNGSAGNWSITADFAAAGSTADVPSTFIFGVVRG